VADRGIDVVVFDYGGVLTAPTKVAIGGWLAAEGILPDSYRATMREWLVGPAAVDSPVARLEAGQLSADDFEREFAPRLVTESGTPVVAEGLLRRMFGRMRPDPTMLALVGELRTAGLRVALLSNSWGATAYPDDVLAICDPVVISGAVGLRKPDPRIYRLVLDRLPVPAGRTVFVDDTKPNVTAARELGMHGVLHVDPATTRAELRSLVPDLPAAARCQET
jgi:putative hydrolase of the HAD superfamily